MDIVLVDPWSRVMDRADAIFGRVTRAGRAIGDPNQSRNDARSLHAHGRPYLQLVSAAEVARYRVLISVVVVQ
jgi:hypothetical protein